MVCGAPGALYRFLRIRGSQPPAKRSSRRPDSTRWLALPHQLAGRDRAHATAATVEDDLRRALVRGKLFEVAPDLIVGDAVIGLRDLPLVRNVDVDEREVLGS